MIKEQIEKKIKYLKSLNSEDKMVQGQLIGLLWVLSLIKQEELESVKIRKKVQF